MECSKCGSELQFEIIEKKNIFESDKIYAKCSKCGAEFVKIAFGKMILPKDN